MNDTISLLGQQVPIALVLVFLQNWLKQQKWFPLLTYQSARMNHLAAIILSGLATVGIHETHTGSMLAGGTLTIVVPPITVVLAGAWHWLQQYIVTKTGYVLLQSQLNPPAAQQPTPVVVVPGSRPIAPATATASVATPPPPIPDIPTPTPASK